MALTSSRGGGLLAEIDRQAKRREGFSDTDDITRATKFALGARMLGKSTAVKEWATVSAVSTSKAPPPPEPTMTIDESTPLSSDFWKTTPLKERPKSEWADAVTAVTASSTLLGTDLTKYFHGDFKEPAAVVPKELSRIDQRNKQLYETCMAVKERYPQYLSRYHQTNSVSRHETGWLKEGVSEICHASNFERELFEGQWHSRYKDHIEKKVESWNDVDHRRLMNHLAKIGMAKETLEAKAEQERNAAQALADKLSDPANELPPDLLQDLNDEAERAKVRATTGGW